MNEDERRDLRQLQRAINRLRHYLALGREQSWIQKPLAWALYQVWREVDSGEI